MKVKFYPRGDEGYSAKEITTGVMWIYADVECDFCGKLQPVAATHYVGGPCVRCGELTRKATEDGR